MSRSEKYKWSPLTKELWLEQVRKENPGRNISDFQKRIAPAIVNEPFCFFTDLTDEGNIHLAGSHPGHWKTGIRLLADELPEMKRNLDYALENGVEYIHFNIPAHFHKQELDLLLEHVKLDYIDSLWSIDPQGISMETLKNFLSLHCSLETVYILSPQNSDSLKFPFPNLLKLPSFDLEVWIQILGSWIQDMENRANSQTQLMVALPLSNAFLVNIASLRALKAVLQKLSTDLNWDLSFKMEASIDSTILGDDPHQNVIQISTISLSAVLAGIDFLCIETPDLKHPHHDPKWLRTAVHIGHIMKQESFLSGLTDPMSGSYYIEQLTEQIAKNIWEGLQNYNHT